VIDSVYPRDKNFEAHAHAETGHKKENLLRMLVIFKWIENYKGIKMKLTRILFMMIILLASCGTSNVDLDDYLSPEDIGDGIEVGTLDDVNMDAKPLLNAIDKIAQGRFNEVHSMLIYKNDKLVLEEYFSGHRYQWDAPDYHGEMVEWDKDMFHPIMSCTKSFVSACIGIAIDKGFIDSVQQSIFDYLPNHQQMNYDNREYITIEHLITMTSGLAWDEWSSSHGTSANDIDRLYFECDDPIVCVLEKPWWAVPGELFTYNGGGMVILGEILKNASGMDLEEFSMKYLFEPMGVDSTSWTRYPNGMIDAGGSLRMTPRDMIKLGITYLNEGIWDGARILASEWVEKSSFPYRNNTGINIPIEDSGRNGYAYTWWTSEFTHSFEKIKMFRAGGWGGQSIMVFPELEMVLVFTGGNYAARSSLYEIIRRFVLPAVY
jgi:CubicO group peptidase (beta-lactamase class C family)